MWRGREWRAQGKVAPDPGTSSLKVFRTLSTAELSRHGQSTYLDAKIFLILTKSYRISSIKMSISILREHTDMDCKFLVTITASKHLDILFLFSQRMISLKKSNRTLLNRI